MLALASGLVLLGGLVAGGLWLQRATSKEPAPPPVAPQQQPQLPPPKMPVEAATAAPLAQGPHDEPHVTYPDGSMWPALNGVKKPAAITWPQGHPFAPVVGKIRDSLGVEFYRHADGSLSTTQMMFRKDLGRDDAISQVYLPIAPVPVVDDDNKPIPPSPRRN